MKVLALPLLSVRHCPAQMRPGSAAVVAVAALLVRARPRPLARQSSPVYTVQLAALPHTQDQAGLAGLLARPDLANIVKQLKQQSSNVFNIPTQFVANGKPSLVSADNTPQPSLAPLTTTATTTKPTTTTISTSTTPTTSFSSTTSTTTTSTSSTTLISPAISWLYHPMYLPWVVLLPGPSWVVPASSTLLHPLPQPLPRPPPWPAFHHASGLLG